MWLKGLTKYIAVCAVSYAGLLPGQAQAGPLLDWLLGRNRAAAAYPVGQPVPIGAGYAANFGGYPPANYGYTTNYGTYYGSQLPVIGPAGAGYTAPPPSGVTAATLPSTLSYVPNFRTNAYRAPVTYYRPLLTTDPATGAQVVAMAPCTSYEYQTQRVPALGRRALFGSNRFPPVVPAPSALPTYTLPSGGIPLAYSQPTTSPYATGYRGYTVLQPQAGLTAPAGAYPTAPLGGGSVFQGGSCGSYVAPTAPGLVAPQAPSTNIVPGQGYGSPVYPGTSEPPLPGTTSPPATGPGAVPGGVFPPPPSGAPSSDPAADVTPSLPSYPAQGSQTRNQLRPQLRSIVRQPAAGESTSTPGAAREEPRRSAPVMSPIPAPEGYEPQPRWNPGLLQESDRTALRPIAPELAAYAGQSKRIHWASFQERPAVSKPSPTPTSGLRSNLRPIAPPSNNPRDLPTYQYDNSGWKSRR